MEPNASSPDARAIAETDAAFDAWYATQESAHVVPARGNRTMMRAAWTAALRSQATDAGSGARARAVVLKALAGVPERDAIFATDENLICTVGDLRSALQATDADARSQAGAEKEWKRVAFAALLNGEAFRCPQHGRFCADMARFAIRRLAPLAASPATDAADGDYRRARGCLEGYVTTNDLPEETVRRLRGSDAADEMRDEGSERPPDVKASERVKVGDVVKLWNEDAGWYGDRPVRVTKMRKAPRVMYQCWGDYIDGSASVCFTVECVCEVNGVEIEW